MARSDLPAPLGWVQTRAGVAAPVAALTPHSPDLRLKSTDQQYTLPGASSFEPAALVPVRGPVHESLSILTPPQTPRVGMAVRVSRAAKQKWPPLSSIWKTVPGYGKLMAVIMPLIFAAVWTGWAGGLQKHGFSIGLPAVQRMLASKWGVIGAQIQQRAAIQLTDDFRTGLDEWRSVSNTPASWSYDAAGFVRPGALAIYRPSLELSDYRLEFLAQIDQKAMGFVFRASDLSNYYAVTFVIAQPGPLPVVELVRYGVIKGKEGPHVVRRLPMVVRNDTWYRVRLDVRGQDFTLMIQDQVADYWSEGRLKQGGIGFFCGRGERARLRWVEVSHQADALGKLCAYLAPPGSQNRLAKQD